MKLGLYPKLAFSGIRKNGRLYLPYILTCVGMVMMYYIVRFLSCSERIREMSGGDAITATLSLGALVIALFALIFLTYTNSFLMRRRNREFGLYSILGMGKRNIGRILVWETLITAAISLAAGLFLGILLSKLAELGLVNIMRGSATLDFSVDLPSVYYTALTFAAIFIIILIRNLVRVRIASPKELISSESSGERPPRANWGLGLLGLVILAAAYYIAVTIKEPLSAMMMFFVAVIMVIVATYMLFISGSVALCRALQRNRGYYYKPDHFVSVSSMAYRMKRNGAGLASICILATMVLVTISSTTCLYFGAEDSLNNRYPREISVTLRTRSVEAIGEDSVAPIREALLNAARDAGAEPVNAYDYRAESFSGMLCEGDIITDHTRMNELVKRPSAELINVYLAPLEDYNRAMGSDISLGPEEALIYTRRMKYGLDSVSVNGGKSYKIKGRLDGFMGCGDSAMDIMPSLFMVVGDYSRVFQEMADSVTVSGETAASLRWYFAMDTGLDGEGQLALFERLRGMAEELKASESEEPNLYMECRESGRGDFYGTYGGLFFLGLMLSGVFICAAVLIIYYKQISEGYEDQARFDIMQKVGMTKKNIRRSINSQLMTVFYMPFAFACVHLAFAFPMIEKILRLFNLNNVWLFAFATAVSVAVFALLYTLVYRATSNAYCAIVSGAREERA